MAEKKQDFLKGLFGANVVAGKGPTGPHDVPVADWNPAGTSQAGGHASWWKKIGIGALNTLSVPQAALFTLIQKAGHTVAPSAVQDSSWKNLAGTFRGKSYRGGAGLLQGFGVDSKAAKKWGGLGLDLVADPLNLVGAGLITKAVKGAHAATDVADIFKAVEHANIPRDVLSKEARTAGAKALTAQNAGVSLGSHFADTTAALDKALKGKKKVSDLRATLAQHDSLNVLRAALAKAERQKKPVKGLRNEIKRLETDLLQTAVRDKFPAIADPFKGTFKAPKVKPYNAPELNAQALIGGAGRVLDKTPASEGGNLLDQAGVLTNADRAIRESSDVLRQQAERAPGQAWGINIGIGKFKKGFAIKDAKAKGLHSDFRHKLLVLNPAQKLAHGLQRSTSELAQGTKEAIMRFGLQQGLTHADNVLIQNVALINQHSAKEGASFIEHLRSTGDWTPAHDTVFNYVTGAGRKIAKSEGLQIFAEQQAKLELQLAEAVKTGNQAAQERISGELQKIAGKGDYVHSFHDAQTAQELSKHARDSIKAGLTVPNYEFNPNKMIFDPKQQQKFHPFTKVTEDAYRQQMAAAGLTPELTNTLAERVNKTLGFADAPQHFKDTNVIFKPEWDALKLLGDRFHVHYSMVAQKEIDNLIKEGIPDHVFAGLNLNRAPGAIGSTVHGRRLQMAISYMKAWFITTPAHYVNNAVGDYWNRLINGNLTHLGTKAFIPKSEIWKLAKGDQEALLKEYNIQGKVYKGEELLALSRLAGLGRGYVGTDINQMVDLLHHGKWNPIAMSSRFNMNRENAQRLETWLKHLKAGDDPFTAAAKSLKVHFDYGELTDFEKTWMRNILLFYTWLKKNSQLQASGLMTRPGLYQAYADLQTNRQKFVNEPAYYGQQGAVTIPGLGNIFASGFPANDIYKWDLTTKGLTQNLGSAITPPVRIPLEIMSNKNFFTGAPVEAYTDQNKPYWLANLIGGTKVKGKPGLDAQTVHILSSLLGPEAGIAQTVTTGGPQGSPLQTALRFLGLPRPQVNDQVKFAQAAKVAAARSKADATRKKNQEAQP